MPISSADVVTPIPDRYARALVTQLARRFPASLDAGTTLLRLPDGEVRVTPVDGVLRLVASAPDDDALGALEDGVSRPLLGLAAQRELAVEWVRASGPVRRLVRSGADAAPDARRPRHRSGSSRVVRRLLRLPPALYRADLGWLLGHRFLMLTHIGRRSGRTHHTVLEVVGYDPRTRAAVIVSGLGRSSDWYLNLRYHPSTEVMIGRERFEAVHRELSPDEALEVFAAYEQRNRWVGFVVRIVLSRLLGWRYYGADDGRRRLVTQLPFLEIRPAAGQSSRPQLTA